METWHYEVVSIGCHLIYEMMQYEIEEQMND